MFEKISSSTSLTSHSNANSNEFEYRDSFSIFKTRFLAPSEQLLPSLSSSFPARKTSHPSFSMNITRSHLLSLREKGARVILEYSMKTKNGCDAKVPANVMSSTRSFRKKEKAEKEKKESN